MSIFHSLIWVGAQCFPKNNLIPLQNKEKRKRNKYLLTLKCNSIIESLNRNKLKKFQLKKKFASRSSLGFTGLKEQPEWQTQPVQPGLPRLLYCKITRPGLITLQKLNFQKKIMKYKKQNNLNFQFNPNYLCHR